MKRHYFIRDRKIEVEEVENVVAVKVATDDAGAPKAMPDSFGTSAVSTLREQAEGIMTDEAAEAFAKANWSFVKPTSALSSSMTERSHVDNADDVGKIIRRQDGSVGISTTRLNVQLKPEFSAEQCADIFATLQIEVITKLKFAPNLYEVQSQRWADSLEASVELHEDSRFILAEPSFIEHIPQRLTPTDPNYSDQWQWNNTGTGGGTAGADVSAEGAWDHTLGEGIRVAVIDNGFDADHQDLATGVVGESGYFQSPAVGSTTFVQGTTGMPGSSHGTFCAGMVGARHNNGNGGCGAAPGSELMLLACLGDQVGTQTTLARAVAYAANPTNEVASADPADGADILVCSLGPNGAVWNLTGTLELALESAASNGRSGRGLAIFWAASNGANVNVSQDEVVSHEDVIAVVRSDRNDKEDNAARGDGVELIAPGKDVYSTRPNDTYGTSTGTSFAAPCAAGCAALALSTNPDLTRDQLRQIMRDTADKIGGVTYDANGHNDDYGYGRVNAEQAVLRASASAKLPQPGTYTIQQKSNNRFLDAHENSSKDFSVVTRTAQNNDTQRWILTPVGGVYTIQHKSNNRFMDAHENAAKDFSIVTRSAQNNNTQRWVLIHQEGTLCTYTIQQLSSVQFMDAHEHSGEDYSAVTRKAQHNDTQRWILAPLGGDTFTIQQKSNDRFLDAHESSANDYSVVTRTKQNNDTQRWIFKLIGGVYTIQQRSNNRLLDAHENAEKDFSVVTRTTQNNNTQKWVLLPLGGEAYSIQQLSNSRYIDAHEHSGKDYSVVTRTAQNNNTQRWLIKSL